MFLNVITCEKELADIPFDKVEEEDLPLFQCVNWQEREFHTDYFFRNGNVEFNDLSSYSISEDDLLYKEILTSEFVPNEIEGVMEAKEISGGIERQDTTGEIYFQDVIMGKKHDYFIQFKASYCLGDLKSLSLHEWEKSDNSMRKKTQGLIKEEVLRIQEKQRRVDNSTCYKIYACILLFFAAIVKLKIRACEWILVKIQKWLDR